MLFSEELEKYSWDEITQQIYAKTDADVERALNKKHLQIDDFMALISPAADKYLEKMAFLSRLYNNVSVKRYKCMYLYTLQIPAQIIVCTADFNMITR